MAVSYLNKSFFYIDGHFCSFAFFGGVIQCDFLLWCDVMWCVVWSLTNGRGCMGKLLM